MNTKAERGNSSVEGEVAQQDTLSGAPVGFETGLSHPVGARTRNTLERIEAALARLDAGRFGFCDNCGDRIDLAALDEDPTRTICETCVDGQS